jgi:hypothetical protein
MPVKITSKKDGFRRAGRAHSGTVTHPDGTFTKKELESLKAEAMLEVEIIAEVEIEPEVQTDSVEVERKERKKK